MHRDTKGQHFSGIKTKYSKGMEEMSIYKGKDQRSEATHLNDSGPHHSYLIIPQYDFSDEERHADVSPTIGDMQNYLEEEDDNPST